jgi:cation transport regulator ChaB
MKIILFENKRGGVSIISPSVNAELAIKDVPENVRYKIIENNSNIEDQLFMDAWEYSDDKDFNINLEKAIVIAHIKRREARSKEFKPFDEIISNQIPGTDSADAEGERQKIRDKYAIIQINIDKAGNVDDLKKLIPVEQ